MTFGKFAIVPLTQGMFSLIDADCVDLVSGYNWHLLRTANKLYAATHARDGSRKILLMHRVIVDADCPEVDHIDGNGLNNGRRNLREATRKENAANQLISARNTSGFKGVSWHKAKGKWRATIKVGDKHKHLGFFQTKDEAAACYWSAAQEAYGEFARRA
jgi:hypothetical protein